MTRKSLEELRSKYEAFIPATRKIEETLYAALDDQELGREYAGLVLRYAKLWGVWVQVALLLDHIIRENGGGGVDLSSVKAELMATLSCA